jgi:iron uptake system component EfeO
MSAPVRSAGIALATVTLLAVAVLGGATAGARPAAAAAAHRSLLAKAVAAYRRYVDANVSGLLHHTRTFCAAVDARHRGSAELLYPKARVYYERVEPVAKSWGYLDTEIDGRWDNPVTVRRKFIGFHRIEQLLWQGHTTKGAAPLCHGLIGHERLLAQRVQHKTYTPIELAAGATDLIDEAAVSKITGEEERYSKTDFVVFIANIQATQEVVALFTPYLQAHGDTAILSHISASHQVLITRLHTYRSSPGYDHTGYVDYTTVHARARRALSSVANAYAEALASLTGAVGAPT